VNPVKATLSPARTTILTGRSALNISEATPVSGAKLKNPTPMNNLCPDKNGKCGYEECRDYDHGGIGSCYQQGWHGVACPKRPSSVSCKPPSGKGCERCGGEGKVLRISDLDAYVKLKYYEGISYKEAAERMAVPCPSCSPRKEEDWEARFDRCYPYELKDGHPCPDGDRDHRPGIKAFIRTEREGVLDGMMVGWKHESAQKHCEEKHFERGWNAAVSEMKCRRDALSESSKNNH